MEFEEAVAFENHTSHNVAAKVRIEKGPSGRCRMVVEIWPDERGAPIALAHGKEAVAEFRKLRGN